MERWIIEAEELRGFGSKILKEQLQIFLTFDENMEPVAEEEESVPHSSTRTFSIGGRSGIVSALGELLEERKYSLHW